MKPVVKQKPTRRKHSFPYKIPSTLQVILALGLFGIALLASRGPQLSTWEADIFWAIYRLPEFLYPFFYAVTQLGSIYVLGGLLVFYLFRQRYHIVIRLLMVGTMAYLLAGFAKNLWGRARPHELLEGVTTLDFIQGPGFPSGHVALAVALALTVAYYLPRTYYWVPIIWITGVALSRMYLGVHVPLDLLGGIAIGWLSYALFRHVRIYNIEPLQRRPKPTRPVNKSSARVE